MYINDNGPLLAIITLSYVFPLEQTRRDDDLEW